MHICTHTHETPNHSKLVKTLLTPKQPSAHRVTSLPRQLVTPKEEIQFELTTQHTHTPAHNQKDRLAALAVLAIGRRTTQGPPLVGVDLSLSIPASPRAHLLSRGVSKQRPRHEALLRYHPCREDWSLGLSGDFKRQVLPGSLSQQQEPSKGCVRTRMEGPAGG